MNSPNFVCPGIIVSLVLTVTWVVANAQISGSGTTGVTAGSGRGIGSGGVMAGTGPDVRPLQTEQLNGGRAQQNISTTTTARSENASSTKKQSQSTRKHLKKTSRHTRATPSASASASPR